MRTIAAALVCVAVTTGAAASSALVVIVLPKPGFPLPVADVDPSSPRLEFVSSTYRSPVLAWSELDFLPGWAPRRVRGEPWQRTIKQGTRVFVVYARDGSSGRYLVGGTKQKLRYAFDFVKFAHAPNGGWYEEVTWAREMDGVLYVETTHLTFASATEGRNAYVSAIDLTTRKLLWRSPALVANARTFVLDGDYIVSGYGFTAESDFLYLLDRRTGRVLDRLAVPSAPEVIKLRRNRLYVRTYDHDVVARVIP